MSATRVFLVCAAVTVAACTARAPGTRAKAAERPAERRYMLERVDDAAVVQLYADGFSELPLRDKVLAWHLYQAAIAGRDIYIDQRHRDALAMRSVVEAVVAHPEGVDAPTLAEIRRYTKLFWINNGPYLDLTARKFLLQTTRDAFARAVRTAVANGAHVATAPGESLDALLTRLAPMFFDPAVDPIVTNKTPGAGGDILEASANNLYVGVRTADLTSFKERFGLNARLVKAGGRLVEEVYRVGGHYDAPLAAVVRHLEAALPFAGEATAAALRALIRWYRTGEAADKTAYDIAWVRDSASTVDTINGFTEVYLDARGVKGGWEAVVSYVNRQKTARIRTIAANAQWFEDHMPWDARYRKPNVQGIVANAIDAIVETGDAGPISPVGINLPNDEMIRERYGSKSVALSNVREASELATPGSLRAEFSWSREEADRSARFGAMAAELTTDMHEAIGHASGRPAATLTGTPQAALKEHFSALEEGRADLVGLYFLADPKLVELGAVAAADQEALVRAAYESYTRNALVQLRRVREGTQIEEDHMRNRQMIVRWLMANTSAIEPRTRDGRHYLVMVDATAFREGCGRLLAEVQRIKSEGDYPAARALFEQYGIHFDPAVRDEVIARVARLDLPAYTGFVMPTLTPVVGTGGTITDVTISYPMDLTRQMLDYSGAAR